MTKSPFSNNKAIFFHFMKPHLLLSLLFTAMTTSFGLAQSPLKVVATVGMIGDVVKTIGGECTDLETMMGPGVDPHLYKATARDVQTLNRAELILYSGYALEGQLGDVLERFAQRVPTLAVSETAIDEDDLIRVDDAYGVDPHLWMDVELWANLVPALTEQLSEVKPECADTFAENAAAYEAELAALHAWISEAVSTIPEEQRLMVTAHDAFSYFGRAYGLEVLGVQGISTESEAGVADIREVAQLIETRNVPAVFIESTINPRTVQAVVDAVRDRGHEVTIGEQLYSDAVGESGTYGGTYLGMLYTNARNVTEGLGGSVPPLPEALSAWANRWDLP